jgi:hypothetical protein
MLSEPSSSDEEESESIPAQFEKWSIGQQRQSTHHDALARTHFVIAQRRISLKGERTFELSRNS